MLLNLARLKSHPHCVFTGVIKNILGLTRCMYGFHMVDYTKWPQCHGDPANRDGWPLFPKKLAYAHELAVGPRIALNILDANEPSFGWRGPGKQRIHTFPAGAVNIVRRRVQGTRQRLWECQCDPPVKLRCAKDDLQVRCEICGEVFVLKAPKTPSRIEQAPKDLCPASNDAGRVNR